MRVLIFEAGQTMLDEKKALSATEMSPGAWNVRLSDNSEIEYRGATPIVMLTKDAPASQDFNGQPVNDMGASAGSNFQQATAAAAKHFGSVAPMHLAEAVKTARAEWKKDIEGTMNTVSERAFVEMTLSSKKVAFTSQQLDTLLK